MNILFSKFLIFLTSFFLYQNTFAKIESLKYSFELLRPDEQNYLPGVNTTNKYLDVNYSHFNIVKQDGSVGQDNPPLNLFGKHIKYNGDLVLQLVFGDLHGEAVIELYPRSPIIYDEWRYDFGKIRLAIEDQTLTVFVFQNGKDNLLEQKKIPLPRFSSKGPNEFRFIIKNDSIYFYFHNTEIGSINTASIFNTHELWFGFESRKLNSHWQIKKFNAIATDSDENSLQIIDTRNLQIKKSKSQSQSLNSLAQLKRPSFQIGGAVALGPLVSDIQYAELALNGNFSNWTTENALKPQFVHPADGVYFFDEADAIVHIAQKHNIKIHGHTLIFGEANPKWMQDISQQQPERMESLLKEHITTILTHFKGKMDSWDVVNEPLSPDFATGQELRNHIWFNAIGKKYIALAFQTAHRVDPYAKLFLNEWGLEEDGPRWNYILQLLKELKQQKVPIYGIGFQSHVYHPNDVIYPAVLQKHFQQLAELGIHARISEMDVTIENGYDWQAQQFTDVLRTCIQALNCDSFSFWGFTEKFSSTSFLAPDGKLTYGKGLPWDSNFQPNLAVNKMLNLLLLMQNENQ